MKFYLGTHMVSWLGKVDVPLFVSHRRLAGRRTFPRARTSWALDSGGFTELSMFGEWQTKPTDYVAAVRRYRDEVGRLDWAAPQDWMCEPSIVAKTGLNVAEHQRRTIASVGELRSLAPDLPFVAVLQGWQIGDYLAHIDAYTAAGFDLTTEAVVGIGSVCRRQATDEIAQIVARVAATGIRCHGFGVKGDGVRQYGWLWHSADSLAWSSRGRHVRPCPHTAVTSCANCLPHALAWRDRVLTATNRPAQLSFGFAA